MKHFLLMLLFAALVAVPFSWVGRHEAGGRVRHGLKIFFEFVAVGLALSWVLFLLP
ncbi:MAG TPA: hypothetical protein VEY09_01375 [Pyrinomonadaceae bacterium]|nr:hypothetical protein [Pyrinomonadaceae bacterium]